MDKELMTLQTGSEEKMGWRTQMVQDVQIKVMEAVHASVHSLIHTDQLSLEYHPYRCTISYGL